MAYLSQIEQLAAMRARGQRPEGFVIVGDSGESHGWAATNRFFHVPAREITDENALAFAGLLVVIRDHAPSRWWDLAQRIAMSARMVTLFDTTAGQSEFVLA